VRSFHSAHTTLFIFLTFTVDRLLKFLCFFQYGTQIVFFFCDYIFFGSNSKTTKSNLLTKDKIKRQGTRVEKVSQRNNGFKMLTSILKLYNLHKFDPLICFQFDFGTNFHCLETQNQPLPHALDLHEEFHGMWCIECTAR